MERYDTIEEELAALAEAVSILEEAGIDAFPEPKPVRKWAKFSIAAFSTFMMLTWVTQALFKRINL
ncbi:MAG: hypothetical protein CMB73_04430 [Euryarchaeota archaeon]|nr:hypothetical protein [Euryarchaeota archaeon]|tara:strand:- start:6547 stop:6744 length:198 start_codon:yes stop_codon:yes gene_type:complete